jgi:DedD protein
MIQDFTREELEPAARDRDTELTLGGGMLLALGCGLVFLCAICFGIGYAAGHRATPDQDTVIIPAPVPKASVTPSGSGTKPGAGQAQLQHSAEAADGGPDVALNPPTAQPVSSVASGNSGSPQAELKTAVDNQAHPSLIAQPDGTHSPPGFQVQPPLPGVQGWMVQIAAVSHSEDAEVLLNALRRRGYAVSARRDSSDSLIHVQTGPFVNRNDANAMRQKLLSDGYNAIVQ